MKNVIIYGMEESDTEDLPERISNILQEIGEKPTLRDCCRIGVKRSTYARPIKFTVSSSDMACQVLRKARLLRLKKGFKSVYMCPDRTFEERQAHKKLLQELKLKHAAYPDKFFAIRNNEVVSVSKNSFPAHGVELLFAFSWLTFRKCFHGSQFILCLLCSGAI